MVRNCQPMIIKLREHLQTAAEATATTNTRHAGTKTESVSAAAHMSSVWKTEQRLHTMRTQEDEEMSDFKWLIDFDLRSVFLQDIDRDDIGRNGNEAVDFRFQNANTQDGTFKKKGKMRKTRKPRILSNNGKSPRSVPYTYSELITRCLSEVGDVSVKEIYNWISERFPTLRPLDITWKNAIRHTLTVNPLFQKRKEDCGKCHAWYLNKSIQNKNESTILQTSNGEIAECSINREEKNGLAKFKHSQVHFIWPKTIILQTEINNDSNSAENGSYSCNSKHWFPIDTETTMTESVSDGAETLSAFKNESDEYYELEIPITSEFTTESTSYTEPIEVRYLIDETAASIPVHIF